MVKKVQNIFVKVGQRIRTSFTNSQRYIRNNISYNIYNSIYARVPVQLRWLIPIVQEEINLRPPTIDQIKNQVFGKPGEPGEIQLVAKELRQDTTLLVPQEVKFRYGKYSCLKGNPLNCEWPQYSIDENSEAKYCFQCRFPVLLPAKSKIRGNRGTYQIERWLGYRGMGRLYEAIELLENQPVIIKEYLLPERYFNQEETNLYKDTFKHLSGINLADGRIQDFRIVAPWEAIADVNEQRCYLVYRNTPYTFPTLASYLAETGAMTPRQVRQTLNQVLQSLESLHGQKYSFPSGLMRRGLPHGNLNLHSLLLVPNLQGFFIYLCDLALWEHRLNPPASEQLTYSITKDLKDLGYIAFYLLAGRTTDTLTHQSLDPRLDQNWPDINPKLKYFILSLIGLGTVTFDSAEQARNALLKLPIEREIEPSILPLQVPEEEKKDKLPWKMLLLSLILLLLLGILAWFLFFGNRQSGYIANRFLPCCISQISGIPDGQFRYTAEKNGTWSYVLKQENLTAKGETLEEELVKRQPKLSLIYEPLLSAQEAISAVENRQADFAITSILEDLPPDLAYEKIAYDAIIVFVDFSYAKRKNSISQALNGQITLEQLRQLYTGKISNWKQLGGPDLPVKLYIPDEDEAVKIFEKQVLKDKDIIAEFRNAIASENETKATTSDIKNPNQDYQKITPLRTFATFREVIRDFETKDIGSISFGTLSKVFGQCSIYPLALVDDNNLVISPLILSKNQPVTPKTDLCNSKGIYKPNVEAFITQRYPLSYPIAVVYPRDNRQKQMGEKFAEIMETVEAQRLLYKTGLVPLQPIE